MHHLLEILHSFFLWLCTKLSLKIIGLGLSSIITTESLALQGGDGDL
jgi:hypothetical protein